MYKKTRTNSILRLHDGAYIPQDAMNADYAAYLAWVAAGNTPQPADQPTLSDVRASKQAEIRDKADSPLASLASEYGAYERLTWDQQAVESDALAANPDAPAPLVRSIAAARSMDPLELASRIRANRAQWVVLSGSVVGQRLAYQDALDAAETVEEIGAIVPVYVVG